MFHIEIHSVSHNASWAGSVKRALLSFLTFFLPSLMFLLLIQFRCLYYRDSEVVNRDHYPNTQGAVEKRNIARNHILAKQSWAKDRNLGPSHSLAGSPPKSSSTILTEFYRETWHKGQPLRPIGTHILSMPMSARCGYSHTSHLHMVGVGRVF